METTTKEKVVTMPELLADDDRGVIEQLVKSDTQSVLRITSKKGTVRANHYHQGDSHLCYLASGKICYIERAIISNEDPQNPELGEETEYTIEPGQLFYTAPMIAHAMDFLEDSEFYCFTPRSGNQEEYENDVIRITLVEKSAAAA